MCTPSEYIKSTSNKVEYIILYNKKSFVNIFFTEALYTNITVMLFLLSKKQILLLCINYSCDVCVECFYIVDTVIDSHDAVSKLLQYNDCCYHNVK